MRQTYKLYLSALLLIGISACQVNSQQGNAIITTAFTEYWYTGVAELSSFSLSQARYGNIHEGKAHIIFVTEDFSRSKQVKAENQGEDSGDIISVLKLNSLRTFQTGIYDYRQMTSVFSPVDVDTGLKPLKITMSSQDWCGQTFMQLNRKGAGYLGELRSYFGSEGDQEILLEDVIPEDGIWSMIRMNPGQLPKGETLMVPGAVYLRLRHIEVKPFKAICTSEEQGNMITYTITYPDLDRSLKIVFQSEFPYRIEGWEESSRSGFGEDATMLTTKADRINTITTPYWELHDPEDVSERTRLDTPTQ